MSVRKALICYGSLRKLTCIKSSRKRQEILGKSPSFIYEVIGDIAKQTLKGVIPLSSKRKANLKRYKKEIRKLASKIPIAEKKRIINQKGGLLPGLLWPAVSILANIAANKLIK